MKEMISQKILLPDVSEATYNFKISSLSIEIVNFVSRMSLLRDQFQGKLTFRFGMMNGQLGRQTFHTSTLLYVAT